MADYNGWTNYATWRINLEIFDGQTAEDITGNKRNDIYDLSKYLKEYVEEILEEQGKGMVLDYALAFVSDVNWYEIAEHLTEEETEEETSND